MGGEGILSMANALQVFTVGTIAGVGTLVPARYVRAS
jgi:hypothetical protein